MTSVVKTWNTLKRLWMTENDKIQFDPEIDKSGWTRIWWTEQLILDNPNVPLRCSRLVTYLKFIKAKGHRTIGTQ